MSRKGSQSPGVHVLVVDDDDGTQDLLRASLESSGYQVTVAADGLDGLREFFGNAPDLVLLDVQMPKMDGWTLLKRIREVSDVPVIMLTGSGQEHQKVQGLRGGADDYLVKPLGVPELLARIDAMLRRVPGKSDVQDIYQDEVLRIDFQCHQVHVKTDEVHLSALEFRLLAALIQNRDTVLSTDRLLDLCWGDSDSGPGSVRVYIGYLRRKVEEDPSNPRLIQTVKEFGYRYRPQVHDAQGVN